MQEVKQSPADAGEVCSQETIQVYEKCVSHRNTKRSPYPRWVVDVPAPEVVVAICKKKALITIAALGGVEKCAVSAGCASRGERHQPLQLSSLFVLCE